MGFKMHRYDDGITGLAAFCDVCGEQITDHGYVVWNYENLDDWLVVHQSRCDPGRRHGYSMSMPLDAEVIYLANSAGVDLKKAMRSVAMFDSIR